MSNFKLLTAPKGNPKTAKGMKRGVMTFALHLAPANLSGYEVCPRRTAGCTAACLNTAGRAGLPSSGPVIQAARIRRTKWYFEDRAGFMIALYEDIRRAVRYAEKRGYGVAFRLNATSDIPWHRILIADRSLMEHFPQAHFYDYTKVAKRLLHETLPANYHLTFSLAEDNEKDAFAVWATHRNLSVVYRDKATVQRAIASGWLSLDGVIELQATIIDGDETDLRYLDPKGCVVALYAKGKAKNDTSGFVRDI